MRPGKSLSVGVAAVVVAVLAMAQAAVAATPVPGSSQRPPSVAGAARMAQNADTPVVVVMKSQPAPASPGSAAGTARANAIAAAQAPLLRELTRVHATRVKRYGLANTLAATVSKDEAARLASNPAVARVVPDGMIKGPEFDPLTSAQGSAAQAAPSQRVCPPPGGTLLEPEALPVTHTASDDPRERTAQSLGFTGKGVKVAFMAEGIDIDNPDFIRADGSHVFVDYRDFSGDGPDSPTNGGEAFLDASSIAAQGRKVYDVSHFSAHPQPAPCNLRILGSAPGAQLVGLKVFGENNATTVSGFLQAIQYAVLVDHVDVLNQSFGGNPFPDTGSQDAVRLFDEAAVAFGVTVTVSSGDAGTTSTIGSPSTDPAVISVGGSTDFRWMAQTGYGAFVPFAKAGWLNDNITSLSSGGFTQSGRTIDLVAPGDSSFAVCTPDPERFTGCTDLLNRPSDVERSGGTSQSAPLAAGTVALVIEAYRHAHHGSRPSPALIKEILTSTADDLGVPSYEQGAGRLNSLEAVQAALSIHDAHGSPKASGRTLLTTPTQLDAANAPDTGNRFRVRVTNTGAASQTVRLSGRAFGAPRPVGRGSVTLSDTSSPHFADWQGVPNNFGSLTFKVPAHVDRLEASIAYPGNPARGLNARVRLILIDPLGRYAAHSLPQGVGNFGNVDVRVPVAGTWQAVIFSHTSATGGTVGTVQFGASTTNFTHFGSVSPSSLRLEPGQSGTVTVGATTPSKAGDSSAAVVLDAGSGQLTTVPVIERSLIQPGRGGAFSGVLTGGNGRQFNTGQTSYFQFDVPRGQRDLDANFSLANDPGQAVFAFLVDPRGQALGYSANRLVTGFDPDTGAARLRPLKQASLYHANPAPGRWTLILNFAGPVVGDELSQPFSGTVRFNQVDIHASGLPNDAATKLPAGKPLTVQVSIHNTGVAPENFFLDARLDSIANLTLPAVPGQPTTGVPLPRKPTTPMPAWLVPSQTDRVTVAAQATVPVTFDFGWDFGFGDPDMPAVSSGRTAVGGFHADPVVSGEWFASPAEFGPFGDAGPAPGTADLSMVVHTRRFDQSISSPTGDFWRTSVDPATRFSLLTIEPGQTRTIPVTITPTGKPGTAVSGSLFVDDLTFVNVLGQLPSADELKAIPYRYTVG
jgi:hypothetical protein